MVRPGTMLLTALLAACAVIPRSGPGPAAAVLVGDSPENSSTVGDWQLVFGIERYEHSAIFDPVRNRMLVFGGRDKVRATRNDLWALDLENPATWRELRPAGIAPTPRASHSAMYDVVGDRMLVFGGQGGELWELSLSGTMTWGLVAAGGVAPSGGRALYDPIRHRILVFGGVPSLSVWELPLSGPPVWSALATTGAPPVPRSSTTVSFDPVADRVIVLGRFEGPGVDVRELDLSGEPAWRALVPSGGPPPARSAHATIHDGPRNRLIVSGGLAEDCPLHALECTLADRWILTLDEAPTWSRASSGLGRAGHSAVHDPRGDRMIVFGGYYRCSGEMGCSGFDEGFAFATALASMQGTFILAKGVPFAESEHAAVWDESRDAMLSVGGASGANDVWAYRPGGLPAWEELATTQGPPIRPSGHTVVNDTRQGRLVTFGGTYSGAPVNEVWQLPLSPPLRWQQMLPSGGPPSPRIGHTAIFDPVRVRMVVFGGLDATHRNDSWELSLSGAPTWSGIETVGVPPSPRRDHTAIYDPIGDRMIVFGGRDGIHRNDVWQLTLGGTQTWSQILPSGRAPYPLSHATAIYDPVRHRMVVHGGSTGGGFVGETWALALGAEPAWSQLPHGPDRGHHVATYDPVRDAMLIFGGYDNRSFYSLRDIWCLTWDAPVAALVYLVDVGVEEGRIELTWQGPGNLAAGATVERRTPGSEWQGVGMTHADGGGRLRFEDADVVPGGRYAYRLRYETMGQLNLTAEHWIDVPVTPLALHGLSPSPATGPFDVSFSLPSGAPALLRVYDVAGRLMTAIDVSAFGAGRHRVRLDEARTFRSGVYSIQLTQGERILAARGLVIR